MKYIRATVGLLKIIVYKCFHFRRLSISGLIKCSPSVTMEFINRGRIILGSHVSIGKNSEIASVDSTVEIGNNVHIGDYNMIISRTGITIGNGTILGPHVYIFDHDHAISDGCICRNEYKTQPIRIGKNSWIGANTVILKGVSIGDNCIIGAGTVVYDNVPNNSCLVQKRQSTLKKL